MISSSVTASSVNSMAAKKKTGGGRAATAKKAPRPRKKSAPGKSRKKKAGQNRLGRELKRQGLAIAILLAVCLSGAMVADLIINSGRPVSAPPVKDAPVENKTALAKRAPAPAVKTAANSTEMIPVTDEPDDPPPHTKKKAGGLKKKASSPDIVYEVFDDAASGHVKKTPRTQPKPAIPQIAIIIDDIGYDKALALALFSVSPDITFSVLPFSPHGRTIARRLGARGAELMLHLPMEPAQYPKVNPGPGALLSSMPPDVLLDQLRKDLDAVPGVVGVNNHMGSKLTADADKMNQIFTVLKQKNLFFIDSRTSAQSKGEAAARLFMIRFSHRDVFLDNFQNVDYITGQLRKLIRAARKHGAAIGIGHPYPATLEALRGELPKLSGKVELVPASRLVAIPG